jgi:hypothetical protein
MVLQVLLTIKSFKEWRTESTPTEDTPSNVNLNMNKENQDCKIGTECVCVCVCVY